MKQVNSLMAVCFVFACTLVIASCSKEGPAGPAGAAGATGPAGATGAAGPKGDTGVANVIYSDWLDVAYTGASSTPGDTLWTGIINAAKLDLNILNKGEMKVYINFGSSATPDVAPIPYFDGGTIINVEFTLQKIYLFSTDNAGTVTQAGVKRLQYRYILIPGAKGARSAIDWNNYAAVKQYLNLKD
ncbi:MAG: hypothetical protein ABIQ88_22320 [Chitinophagaceae bacterium]